MSKRVREWLVTQGIRVLKWPPISPDLNPIKIVWAWLKQEVYKLVPNLHELGKEDARKKLEEVLPQAWENISWDKMKRLVETYPRRIQAVLKARGWYTKY